MAYRILYTFLYTFFCFDSNRFFLNLKYWHGRDPVFHIVQASFNSGKMLICLVFQDMIAV